VRIKRRPLKPPNRRRATFNHYLLITLILGLGALLRSYRIDVSPLRGDEAFAVRYWAALFPAVMALARLEPHPLGIFFAFGAWKALVGASELAMRWLPMLVNLLGISAMYGLGHRLFGRLRSAADGRAGGYLAALLWAVNPFLIWHAQDVRDYALWSALSAVALLALLRAAQHNTGRAWLTYAAFALIAVYGFFLEPFFVLIGALALALWYPRRALRFVLLWVVAGALLIPWAWQVLALAGSGYRGSAGGVVIPTLWEQFVPIFTFGEAAPDLYTLWPAIIAIIACGVTGLFWRRQWRLGLFLTAYLLIPTALLIAISTRMNVYLPRYLIAIEPALILSTVACALIVTRFLRRWLPPLRLPLMLAGAATYLILGAVLPLGALWHSGYHKASDWRALRDYLVNHTQPSDTILFTALDPTTGALDPAFAYYFSGPNPIVTLPGPSQTVEQGVATLAAIGRPIWFIPTGQYAGGVDAALRRHLQLISDRGVGADWIVREFRGRTVDPGEIHNRVNAAAGPGGGGAQLVGYSLDQTADQLTVILYWGAVGVPRQTVTVQLIGPPDGTHPSPLWSQDDHPAAGLRDVYTLRLEGLPAGTYALQVGLYDPAAPNARLTWTNDGQPVGDALPLGTIHHLLNPAR
jgi:hypothetical protein